MNAALLSRFGKNLYDIILLFLINVMTIDLIFILLDRPDEQRDQLIGEHILHHSSFSSSFSSQDPTLLPPGSKRQFQASSKEDDEVVQQGDGETLAQQLRDEVEDFYINL